MFDTEQWAWEEDYSWVIHSFAIKTTKEENGSRWIVWDLSGGRLNRNSMNVPSAAWKKKTKKKVSHRRSESRMFFPFQTTWNILLLRSHWNTLFIHFSNSLFSSFLFYFFRNILSAIEQREIIFIFQPFNYYVASTCKTRRLPPAHFWHGETWAKRQKFARVRRREGTSDFCRADDDVVLLSKSLQKYFEQEMDGAGWVEVLFCVYFVELKRTNFRSSS